MSYSVHGSQQLNPDDAIFGKDGFASGKSL